VALHDTKNITDISGLPELLRGFKPLKAKLGKPKQFYHSGGVVAF
jgi:hypothetical protein